MISTTMSYPILEDDNETFSRREDNDIHYVQFYALNFCDGYYCIIIRIKVDKVQNQLIPRHQNP